MRRMMAIVLGTVFSASLAMAGEQISVGQFSMYDDAPHKPTGCDTGISLTLDEGELTGPVALMSDFVSGLCEIYVIPNQRFAPLDLEATSCGSKIWKGVYENDQGRWQVKVTDHRTRLCRDIVPARVILEISQYDDIFTYYSDDRRFTTPQ